MNIYNKAQKNNIDIPTEAEYKKMKENGINLNSYVDYKIEVKNQAKASSGQKDLKDKEKIDILLKSDYTIEEKQAIYENHIKSSKDEQYDILKYAVRLLKHSKAVIM